MEVAPNAAATTNQQALSALQSGNLCRQYEYFSVKFPATFLEVLRHNVCEGFTLTNY
jgi:hypothetical protein